MEKGKRKASVRLLKSKISTTRGRKDSSKDTLLKMWPIFPLWLWVELAIKIVFEGELFYIKKGREVEVCTFSVCGKLIDFCTTPSRMDWLFESGFFESKMFIEHYGKVHLDEKGYYKRQD